MKILTLHCDYIKFKSLKKALNKTDDAPTEGEISVKEPLVVLTAVEKGDSEKTVSQLVSAVEKTAKEVKTENIVLYPYAHLSSNLASPNLALELLKKSESLLSKNFKVTRAPFGYYKSFELKCKGHPLSELSKEFVESFTEEKKGADVSDYDTKQLIKEISRSKLDTSKLKENDHRILGQKLDLFSFHEVAPGSVFWHKNGKIIYNQLTAFSRELHEQFGYDEIETPQVLDNKLWKISGHWEHYKNSMFITKYEKRDFGVKPMNCPGMMLIYKSNIRSYKDLPLRLFEFGKDHRVELSGVLAGLFRLIQFTQDDAHIFCTKEQIGSEIKRIIELIDVIYKKTFKMNYHLEFSTRPEKFMGEKKDWDAAEKELESVLKQAKIKFKINKGDGAFYGPKIDIHLEDSLGRNWQTATIQLDMQMPKRFDLEYIDKDNKRKTPIVIHRAIFGSLERFIGILLEQTSGSLPVWLSPIQVRIINFTDRNTKAAEKFVKQTKEDIPRLRIDADLENTTVNDKVRKASLMKIPFVIVIGEKEEKSKTLAIRTRDGEVKSGVKIEDFVKEVKEKIERRG
ncbi:threonine--tRNA ligase [Candidatus Pacearchaeota archaeon]|nr:threonine--tRNA ligase [Candidatus Pacearchaeota archaeon]